MTKTAKSCLTRISAILIFCVGAERLPAQTAPATITAPTVLASGRPTAAITFPSGASLQLRSTSDLFPLVAADAGASVNIQLRFPVNLAGATLIAQAPTAGAHWDAATGKWIPFGGSSNMKLL